MALESGVFITAFTISLEWSGYKMAKILKDTQGN